MAIKKIGKHWGLLVVLLLSLGTIKTLLQPGFFPIHDDTQIVRVQQMALALKDGQFPVRWVRDLGYGFGYPLYNFYAPLAYYCGAFFNLLGFDALMATKLMMISGIFLAGANMFFLARKFWGEAGGIIAGLFYVYAPYFGLDLYVRGAVGELWAMAFLPLVFLSIWKLNKNSKKQPHFFKEMKFKEFKWILGGGLSYAAVVLAHNLTAMMLMPFIFITVLIFLIFSENKRFFLIQASGMIFFALGLSAFYWLPALSEMSLTKVFGQIGGGADWRYHFVFLDQLWASPWGFGGSAPGRLDGMSFMIGKLHLLFCALALIGFLVFRLHRAKKIALVWGALFFILAVFLTNQNSRFIWKMIKPMDFIQYPWRFLTLATFSSSFLAGSVISWAGKKPKAACFAAVLIMALLLTFNNKYFQPQYLINLQASDCLTEENIKWETSKTSDEYLPRDFPVPKSKAEVAWGKVAFLKGEAELKNLVNKTPLTSFEIAAQTKTEMMINTAYFPGWQAYLDDQKIELSVDQGKMKLALPAGKHQIAVRFTNTPIRNLSNLISLLFLSGIGFYVLKLRHG